LDASPEDLPPPDRIRPAGSETPPVSLVLTLYDEEDNVAAVAEDLLATFRRADTPLTLILVDNGSRDGTRAIVQELEASEPEIRGVYLDSNAGYGGGILAGMNAATDDILGYMWGDDQVAAEDVIRVYRRLVADQLDIAKARRVQRDDGWKRFLVTKVYNTVTLWWFHIPSIDANGCPKFFTRDAWNRLRPSRTDWFLDPEIMIGVADLVMNLGEVDVVARARTKGKSKVKASTVVEFAINLTRARLNL
jgi:glycosyltransferase involved in cell wall biosynthesis